MKIVQFVSNETSVSMSRFRFFATIFTPDLLFFDFLFSRNASLTFTQESDGPIDEKNSII